VNKQRKIRIKGGGGGAKRKDRAGNSIKERWSWFLWQRLGPFFLRQDGCDASVGLIFDLKSLKRVTRSKKKWEERMGKGGSLRKRGGEQPGPIRALQFSLLAPSFLLHTAECRLCHPLDEVKAWTVGGCQKRKEKKRKEKKRKEKKRRKERKEKHLAKKKKK